MFDEIKPEGTLATTEKQRKYARDYAAKKRAEKRAMKLVTGKAEPRESFNPKGRPKSIVNRVTEYGALFNQLNDAHMAKGLPPLKTAMEVLIEAMQSDELDIQQKSKIAEKLATFESSRAPIISIEHVQNINKEEDIDADDALEDFMNSLRKV
jgi:hypothetical protein|tara:strand:- start:2709 stop:3167 length:459 start_codon:yes stop_codon:yes gene_type:complete